MCSGTDYLGWLCDECYANVQENEDAELCDDCLEHMCDECRTETDYESSWCECCDKGPGKERRQLNLK